MQWFPFQGNMFHTANNIKLTADDLESLLKLFSMFKISIWYDDTIGLEDVPEAVGIICINSGKRIGCLLENKTMENFITPFVTNIMFRNVGLYWMIKLN